MSSNVYAEIAEKVETMLASGIVPWQRGFSLSRASLARSHATGKIYSFLNQLLLGEAGEFWTFEQAKKARLKVKKGSKASHVYFWRMIEVTDKDTGDLKEIPFLKRYCVFASNCIEGAPSEAPLALPENPVSEAEKIAKNYLDREGIRLKSFVGTPCYIPASDSIQLPARSDFKSDARYFATLFHEIAHSTGTKKRLDRVMSQEQKEDRAREELVAEIAAAALCRRAGIEPEVDENHAAYCAGWLKELKSDPRAIVWAASRADAAVKFVLGEE